MKNEHIKAAVARGIDPTKIGTEEKLIDALLEEIKTRTGFSDCQNQVAELCAHIVVENVRREEKMEFDDGWNNAFKTMHTIVLAMTPNA